jgi:DNA-binding XRE family transcriptional regulator
MSKEIRKDLYTQSEYAKKMGVSRARINQMIKSESNDLKTVQINGAVLIKL